MPASSWRVIPLGVLIVAWFAINLVTHATLVPGFSPNLYVNVEASSSVGDIGAAVD